MKSKEKLFAIIFGIMGLIFVLWLSGLFGLWINGISYISNNVEGYFNNAHQVDGEFVVEIDLSDFGDNEGKTLYDDGENQIYVSRVFVHNKSDYQVSFRSSGNYSLSGATLVSGIEHAYSKNGFTSLFHAEAKATYRGKTFALSPSGSSGLNYRDGDEFGFYLFPSGNEIDIDLVEESIVEVTITNLHVNLWARKVLR